MDEIAVPAVNLDRVEARRDGDLGGVAEGLDDRLDLADRQLPRRDLDVDERGQRRRRHGLSAGGLGGDLAAAVADLQAGEATGDMDRVDDVPQPVAHLGQPHPGDLVLDPALGGDRAEGDRRQPRVGGAFAEKRRQVLVGQARVVSEPGGHRRQQHPVAQRQRADGHRGAQAGVWHPVVGRPRGVGDRSAHRMPRQASVPRSIVVQLPVIIEDSSPARKTTSRATSSGSPRRLNMCVPSSCCLIISCSPGGAVS